MRTVPIALLAVLILVLVPAPAAAEEGLLCKVGGAVGSECAYCAITMNACLLCENGRQCVLRL